MLKLEEILKRKAELREQVATRSAELKMEDIEKINKELDELESQEKEVRAKMELDKRMAQGQEQVVVKSADKNVQTEKQLRSARGARYKVKDGKPVDIREAVEGTAQNGVLIPSHLDRDVTPLPWNEVSSVLDVVDVINLPNGNEYTKAFQIASDEGAYTLEPTITGASKDGVYHEVDAQFDKVTIKRNKITAITYESEELELLPDADYASIIERNVALSIRKKLVIIS